MIKYATAIRVGAASTEAIVRRSMKTDATHPTYQAMIELGRAQKTIFLARYLRSRTLQCEIHQGLNVVESWSRANSVIFYGKSGDLATNRRDEREMSLLCLRILRAALVYVNTLMLQDILADLDWEDVLTTEDMCGLAQCGRRTKPDRMAGQLHSLTGDANRYNGSRRTRHVDYVMVRS
jgi:TnpA family transposase